MPGICWLDPSLITPELKVVQARIAAAGWRVERSAPLTPPGDLPTTYDVKVAVGRTLAGIGPARGSVLHLREKETGTPLLDISMSTDKQLPAGWEAELDRFLLEHDPRASALRQAAMASRPKARVPRWSMRTSVPVSGKGHVFVSYSRKDEDYVHRLVAYLRDVGVECWIDTSKVEGGERWQEVIRANIDAAAAFVVVMTPSSENRPWVMREITEAERRGKPILPLLLEGEEFFRLSDYQFESVVGGTMPSDRWVQRLRDLSAGNSPAT